MTAAAIVRTFLGHCSGRDLDAALQFVTADVEYDNQPIGAVHGPDGVRGVLSTGVMAEADEVEWVVLRLVSEADLVMCERVDRFRFDRRWIDIPVAGIFELREGRISLWRDYFDLASYRRRREEIAGAR